MLHFLQNFTYYMMCEVIEPNWHQFENALGEAQTVDELIDLHERFLDQCMKEGMLFWPKILKRLEKIKSVCLKFAAASASLATALPTRHRRDGGGGGGGGDRGGEDGGGEGGERKAGFPGFPSNVSNRPRPFCVFVYSPLSHRGGHGSEMRAWIWFLPEVYVGW